MAASERLTGVLLLAIIDLKGEILSAFLRGMRNTFARGLLAIIPVAATIYLLWLIYRLFVRLAGATFGPLLTELLGSHWWIPAVGIFLTLILVWLIGLVTRNYAGRVLHRYFEGILGKVPLVNKTYAMAKQVTSAFFRADAPAFKRVVLIEFPRKGVYTPGFITSEKLGRLGQAIEGEFVSVYAPTAPNPLSGWLLVVPKEEVLYPEVSVEEGLRLILSGGVIIPGLGMEEEASLRRERRPWRWLRRGKRAPVEPLSPEGYNEKSE
ncbi:MAG: DUF502 domain-containing protein [Thermoplasmata archaeon]|nr:DUF502 domain-containing protein [Thermoplasmata archaeon]NIY03542.1 DUF502 domain-containing protein [Thermoplasmata archaeon]